MKLHANELPIGKPQTRRKTSKFAPLVALIILLTIPLYYPSIKETSKKLYETSHVYESLGDAIRPNSHLDSPLNTNKHCSVGSVQCNEEEEDGGGTATHEAATTLEKHEIDHSTLNDNNNEPCPGSSPQCNEENDDHTTVHHWPADWEKHEKGQASHLDSHPKENTKNRCSPNSQQCKEAGRHHERREARKKHDKGKGKRPPRPPIDPAATVKESPKQEINKQPISQSNDCEISIRSRLLDEERCDLFTGEWVPNPEGPYYTNDTCDAIQEHQNCIKFGRPDRGFLKWRWKPDDCELPLFDPKRFLELVRGKSLAFVGDSVARNHMQSLICLLSRVTRPVDLSHYLDQNKRYEYRDHDFNISMFWSPYLVKTEKTDPDDEKRPFKLYLDEFNEHWTSKIALFDYVIISAGHWFFRPTYFYLNNRLIGCLYCPESNISHLTSYFSYRRAFRTAFRAINAAAGEFNGVTFLRTYAPSHFEGAAWDRGGDCIRTHPFKRNETVLEDYGMQMYLIQLEELRIAQRAGRRNGVKFRLFDATKAMLLRPDGHPSKYGHWQVADQTYPNDCVHWCLPGPIDSWNDFLQELLKRELGDGR